MPSPCEQRTTPLIINIDGLQLSMRSDGLESYVMQDDSELA